jgi:putative colanic acid biosynthesis acetyltransferase WcaF
MVITTNIAANRAARKWTQRELVGRILWAAAQPLFRFSPRPFWGWRRMLLRIFGAKVGREVHIHPSVRIIIPWNLEVRDWSAVGFDALIYNLGLVRIGQRVTVSQRAHLCAGTHDFHDPTMPLLKPPVTIGDDAWICADAFVGPGIAIGSGAVVGARAVAVRDVAPWTVVAGNPAKGIGKRESGEGKAVGK